MSLAGVVQQCPNTSQIMVGTPSIAENGVIRHSDIPELEGVELVAMLEARYHIPVYLANDMHYKVYGYYRQEHINDQIVTLVNYPAGVLPGTATVHKGTLLTGRNLFAVWWVFRLRHKPGGTNPAAAPPDGGAADYPGGHCTNFNFKPPISYCLPGILSKKVI